MFTNKHHTEETKRKISESMKQYHSNLTQSQKEERARKISNTYKKIYESINNIL